jgi:hypothetical protein
MLHTFIFLIIIYFCNYFSQEIPDGQETLATDKNGKQIEKIIPVFFVHSMINGIANKYLSNCTSVKFKMVC